jgi:formate-dependent nitrite reductase membrane component NrfD
MSHSHTERGHTERGHTEPGHNAERRAEAAIVLLLVLVAALTGAYYGIALFPEGSYPRIMLALPALIAGAAAYALYLMFNRMMKRRGPRRRYESTDKRHHASRQ